jgi:FkbM family methyltransferase
MVEQTKSNLFKKVLSLFTNLGLFQSIIFLKEKIDQKFRLNLFRKNGSYTFLPKHAKYTLQCRPGTSDIHVLGQIFVQREYSSLDYLSGVDLIIDCGANVGYSAAYFLTQFPDSTIVAVEPDPSNYLLLQSNLKPYGKRASIIHSGIWSHQCGLKIDYKGEEWATQVRECKPNEVPDMTAKDIGTILKESGKKRISILKVDIEGSEVVVFSNNYETWLPYVDNLVIEIHNNTSFGPAEDIFFKAIATSNFDISRHEELIICKNRQ